VALSALMSTLVALGVVGQAPAPRKLTFDQSIQLSKQHPGHRGLDAALQARQAHDAKLSVMASDPTVSVNPGYRLNPSGSEGLELAVQVSQSWNLANLGGRRKESAQRERAALTAALRADALTRRVGAARAWIELRVREEDERRVARELEVAQELAGRLQLGVSSGAVLRADVAEAKAYTAEIREGQLDAEGGRVHAELDLAEALGLAPPIEFVTDGPWPSPQLPSEARWPGFIKQAEQLPKVRQAALTRIAAEAQAKEADAQGAWQLTTQMGFIRESPSSHIVSVGVGVKLPIFNASQRSRSKAAARVAQARAQEQAAGRSAGRALAMALHEVKHERERLAVAKGELLPALQELVDLRTRSFQRGQGTILEMFRAKQRLLQAEHLLNRIEGEVRWVEVKAWLLLAAMKEGGQ